MNNIRLINGFVFNKYGKFEKKDIFIKNDIIVSEREAMTIDKIEKYEDVDAEGLYVVPGFVDIHTHGALGCDFCDGKIDSLRMLAGYQRSHGITSFCPTSMTLPQKELEQIFITVESYENEYVKGKSKKKYSRIVGINMEGPFINDNKKGAQNGTYISNPDIEFFNRLQEKSRNRIRLVTIAPEIDGAMDFIKAVRGLVHISLGHSDATFEVAKRAFDIGADHVTHLFNAMPAFNHRDTGIVGAASDDERVYVELICDGVHISPSMIRNVIKMFGEDRVVAISDSMEACGMADGEYALGGQKVYKRGLRAELEDKTIAGSVSNLYDCFKYLTDIGIQLETALKLVTINPAKSIGMDKKIGVISEGAYADLLLLNNRFEIVRIL